MVNYKEMLRDGNGYLEICLPNFPFRNFTNFRPYQIGKIGTISGETISGYYEMNISIFWLHLFSRFEQYWEEIEKIVMK